LDPVINDNEKYLEVMDIRHFYNGKGVLDVPRLSFGKGKIHALVGPNGAGKTTLMLILSLLLKPTFGRVYFHGAEVADDNRRKWQREICMLFQEPILFRATVAANVGYGLKIRHIDEKEKGKRIGECLEMVGLAGFAGRKAGELSGGEAQRVAIARALAVRPALLLLDELTANVDESNTQTLEGIVRSLSKERDTTIVFSTHDRNQAYRLADEIITLMEGRITPFTPENIFRGKTSRDEEGTWFDTGSVRIFLPTKKEARVIYLDPRDILISLTPLASSARNCLEGCIESVTANGDWVRLQVNAGELFHVLITQKSFFELGLNIEKKVHLTFKSSAVQVL
jgi:tungstate transport system ATP-binding protein